MKSEAYELAFSVGTRTEQGILTIIDDRLTGTTPGFLLQGTIFDGKGSFAAKVLVTRLLHASSEPGERRSFVVAMHGACDADGLSLLGAGPKGEMIEVNANIRR